jgi:undecaprenyl diphosphate synthase
VFGHLEGVESVRACVEAAVRTGVRYLSLYAFSEENWNRPQAEVMALMELMVKAMANEMEKLNRNGVRFVVIGNRSRLSDEINASIDECMAMTADNETLTLIVFLSYSGKWDILQAAKKMAAEMMEFPDRAEAILEMGVEGFDRYLATAGIPDPDLIVRTSGECRLSNYLLWQGAYSELLFVDTLWPDFRQKDFVEAVEYYSKRDRRYGKVK